MPRAGQGLRRAGIPDRRNEAIVRFMLEATVRADEVVAMRTTDVDITRRFTVVQGGKGRLAPFGAQTGEVIDRNTWATVSERAAEEARRLNLGDWP
ncbi:MAG: hypothetical protein ACRDR6_13505 [Pseudonocardiaceae bacterium]